MIDTTKPQEEAILLESKAQIEDYIISRAMVYELPIQTMVDIAKCESNFNPKAKNQHSTASGVYQFIKGTWVWTMGNMDLPTDSNRFDPAINIEAAMYLAKNHGLQHWECYKLISKE